MLGCVHETTSSELIVSLPGIGNFGHVKLNNISKVYTNALKNSSSSSTDSDPDSVLSLADMYSRGDYVRCKVLDYSDRHLNLTMEPDVVNASLVVTPASSTTLEAGTILSGAVKSREDHGYAVDLGIQGITAFVRTSDVVVKTSSLSIGQVCLFRVESNKSGGRAISLSVCHGLPAYDVSNHNQFDAFMPGARLVNCTVDRVGKNGLQVSVSKQVTGYVHINHLPAAKRSSLLKSGSSGAADKAYSNGDKISATILFVNPYSRVVYLSLLPHLNDASKVSRVARLLFAQANAQEDKENDSSLHIGQVVENAQVCVSLLKFF